MNCVLNGGSKGKEEAEEEDKPELTTNIAVYNILYILITHKYRWRGVASGSGDFT